MKGIFETIAFTKVGNSRFWSSICLPSSNGFFTARSLARMYGAIVNGGYDEQSKCQLLSAKLVSRLLESLQDKDHLVSELGEARMAFGFSPWSNHELHGCVN
jgi:hypothetical protein